MEKTRIAIVGAAIAGSAAAIFLSRLKNLDISVYEQRKKGAVDSRGAGIALPKTLVKTFIKEGVFDPDFSHINVNVRNFLYYDKEKNEEKLIAVKPFYAYAVHWANLFTNLMKRIPDNIMHYGIRVIGCQREKNEVILEFDDGTKKSFDIVIFSDGYNSLGRRTLFPDNNPVYTNYIAWRGTLERVDEETNRYLLDKVPFYLYGRGHFLIYSIPLLNTKKPEQEYFVNWLIYEYMDKDHPLVKDNCLEDNLPPHAMKPEYINYLHQLADKYFSPFGRDIVKQTSKPFTQAIRDAHAPSYFKDNIALMGDAAVLARPHVGAGSAKALEDAYSLYLHLKNNPNTMQGFADWSVERQALGADLGQLSRDLGELLVTKMPEWKNIDTEKMNQYWDKVTNGHDKWYQITDG